MRSNICKIDNGILDLAMILRESEKVAVYNELDHKQTLHLRLLCEELDGMLPQLVGEFEGEFWIEFENDVCRVNAKIIIDEMNLKERTRLIGVSKSKKNAAAEGIVGKIRSAVECFFLDEDVIGAISLSTIGGAAGMNYHRNVDYTHYWSLMQYKKQDDEQIRDELSQSVIASVADDVIVGVKGNCADIIIVKSFA